LRPKINQYFAISGDRPPFLERLPHFWYFWIRHCYSYLILTGPNSVASYDKQGGPEDRFVPGFSQVQREF
jgi:hypothetical protein